MQQVTDLIADGETLLSAKYKGSGVEISVYDDGFGPLWIHRNSIGVSGIVRAQTWEDAYGICEDEFFPEADETAEEIEKEYGYTVRYEKVIRSAESIPDADRTDGLGAYEKIATRDDYTDNGKLPEGAFLRWATIETPDPDGWIENPGFQESFGFRPNGPNSSDKLNHGIYSKDLNGDYLEPLTGALLEDLGIELEIETDDD